MRPLIRIAMWSGPRNISTAMMRAWENRADCTVWDEPFYGNYLQVTGAGHPHAAQIMANTECDWRKVATACSGGKTPGGVAIHYQKHMTKHMLEHIDLGWMKKIRHAFLIRSPAEVLASYHDKLKFPSAEDVGFARQAELFDRVCDLTGVSPPVLDARDVLENPEAMLAALCAALDVPFDAAMLGWPAGKRDSDGLWAPYWYHNVEQSTGFARPKPAHPLAQSLASLAETCQPHYDRLHALRLRVYG
jgi:hypothetical protein